MSLILTNSDNTSGLWCLLGVPFPEVLTFPKLFGTLQNIQQDQVSPNLKRAELSLALEQKNLIKVIHTEG